MENVFRNKVSAFFQKKKTGVYFIYSKRKRLLLPTSISISLPENKSLADYLILRM